MKDMVRLPDLEIDLPSGFETDRHVWRWQREERVERRPQERGESGEFSLLCSTFSSLLTPALFLAA